MYSIKMDRFYRIICAFLLFLNIATVFISHEVFKCVMEYEDDSVNFTATNGSVVRFKFYRPFNLSDPSSYIYTPLKSFLIELVKNATEYCN